MFHITFILERQLVTSVEVDGLEKRTLKAESDKKVLTCSSQEVISTSTKTHTHTHTHTQPNSRDFSKVNLLEFVDHLQMGCDGEGNQAFL